MHRAPRRGALGLVLALTTIAALPAEAARQIDCPDGVHFEIDVAQLRLRYHTTGLEATMSGLGVLGGRVKISPKLIQQPAAATQRLNEFVKALAAGFNSCALTKRAYEEAIQDLLPAMHSDGENLETVRQAILSERKIDTDKLEQTLTSYSRKLERLASISGKSIDYERIAAVVDEQLNLRSKEIIAGAETNTQRILARIDQLEQRQREAPPPTPSEVGVHLSAVEQQLRAKADEAEAAYNEGYALLERFRFSEAIPHLKRALAAVKLTDFYIALARAYLEEPDLEKAEQTLREGLSQLPETTQSEALAKINNSLGEVLKVKGDLDGALTHMQRALRIDEEIFGPEHPEVANDACGVGAILFDKGDLDGALSYTRRALQIDERVFGPEHPDTALLSANIGWILKSKGDLDGALTYTQRALRIEEKVFGPEHPNVATTTGNVGAILAAKGDLDGGLTYIQRELRIYEATLGPEHPYAAISASRLSRVLEAKGDLDEALTYTQRALTILEKTYGPDNPTTKVVAGRLEQLRSRSKHGSPASAKLPQ